MVSLFDGILFKRDPERFEQIREIAAGFSSIYIGQNIIQDNIFFCDRELYKNKGETFGMAAFPDK